MSILWLLVIVLVVCALVGAPGVGISHGYGWYPSGGVALIVLIIVILLLFGRL